MSKHKSSPDIANFGLASSFLQHQKNRVLYRKLLKEIPIKVDFATLAPLLPIASFSHASNHCSDGDLSSLTDEDWEDFLRSNNIPIRGLSDAKIIRRLLSEVEFVEDGKLRSWKK